MARLGRQVDHFERVDIQGIRADFSPDRKHRYTLQMEFIPDLLAGEREATTTVILKNPSSADEKRSDATIRKVETFVYTRFPNTRYLNIYNIFAFRATDAIELHQLMEDKGLLAGVGPENDSYLHELLTKTDQLICAWGGPSGIRSTNYEMRINQVKTIISDVYSGQVFEVKGLKPTKEPLHGLMWGYQYELSAFKL